MAVSRAGGLPENMIYSSFQVGASKSSIRGVKGSIRSSPPASPVSRAVFG